MISKTVFVLSFSAVLGSLIVYLVAARRSIGVKAEHPDDYFLARNKLRSDEFGNAQIAYALQMSTVYPFFFLSATGNWLVPVVNSICWGLGIFLLYWLLRRFSPALAPVIGESKTIHSFIARTNNAPSLRRLASSFSIIAFAGSLAFEIVYGAAAFRVMFGGNQIVYYVAIAFLAAFLMLYLWNGGQLAALRTDQVQLVVAYVALHLSVAMFICNGKIRIAELPITFLPLLVLLCCVPMFWIRARQVYRAKVEKRPRYALLLYAVILASLAWMMVSLVTKEGIFRDAFVLPKIDLSTSESKWMLATAIILPLFWQFIDLTNWQRIGSLTATTSEERNLGARRGLVQYLFESPLSWLLPVLLGITAPVLIANLGTKGDAFDEFVGFLLTGSGWMSLVVGPLFCAGIVGVMMSTADAFITAIGYAFSYDIHPRTRQLVDRTSLTTEEAQEVISAGRLFMLVSAVIVIAGFVILDIFLQKGMTILGLLFAFYTPLIAFSPAVICPVWFGYCPRPGWSVAALTFGAASGLIFGIWGVGVPAMQWWAAPFAFVISWSLYLVGYAFGRQKVNTVNLSQ